MSVVGIAAEVDVVLTPGRRLKSTQVRATVQASSRPERQPAAATCKRRCKSTTCVHLYKLLTESGTATMLNPHAWFAHHMRMPCNFLPLCCGD